MGAIVELFDGEQLENIASHLFFPEERLVFLGGKNVMTKKRRLALKRFFAARGCAWEPEFIELERLELADIVDAAEAVLAREPGCRFDLTGGSELSLVAMGILSERHGLPLIRTDPRRSELKCLSGPQEDVRAGALTARQLALLYGGCIDKSEDTELLTTDALRADVAGLWQLTAEDRGFLNRGAAFFNSIAAQTFGLEADTGGAGIFISASVRAALRRLGREGFINALYIGTDGLSFSYRDETVKRLLTKAGLTLELLTRIAAEDCGLFSDVCQGVTLDWDGVLDPAEPIETRNEVDVLLLRGMTPVFISCKNGDVRKEALYELEVVAERFGGEYAKKALVCSALTGSPAANESLRRRARDMGITLIENVAGMGADKLSRELAKLR